MTDTVYPVLRVRNMITHYNNPTRGPFRNALVAVTDQYGSFDIPVAFFAFDWEAEDTATLLAYDAYQKIERPQHTWIADTN